MSEKNVASHAGRRKFLKSSITAVAGVTIVPRHVLGGVGYIPPSDKLNLASIGAGGKGFTDIENAYNLGAENVVALCDVDQKQASKAMALFPEAKFYKDFRVMLDNENIDAVTISTPDHTHTVATMDAMRRGIHVYVQKPLTHNIQEARLLTEAAREYKIVTQMGNQGASNPGIKQMEEWFAAGVIGKVSPAYIWTNRPVWPQGIPAPTDKPNLPEYMSPADWDLFIGPAQYVDYHPLYHPFKWRGWWNFGTGALGDMGCHLIDPAYRVLGLGYPQEVECSVGQVYLRDWIPEYIPAGCPPSAHVNLKFGPTSKNDSEVTVVWSDGGVRPFHPDLIPANDPIGDKDSANGTMLIGEKGVMVCGTYGIIPRVYLANGEKLTMPEDYTTGKETMTLPEWGHQANWTAAVKAGYDSKEHRELTSSFDYAGPLTETVLMGNLAIRSYQYGVKSEEVRKKDRDPLDYPGRKRLLWDGENMRITNYEPANQYVGRAYRAGWEI